MKRFIPLLFLSLIVATNVSAQIDIKKPKVKVPTPKVDVKKDNDGSNSGGSIGTPKSDPSGLFSNISDDVSAKSHRNKAVENLTALENMYKKDQINYEELNNLVNSIEKSLQSVKKLEPAVNADKFYERYSPLKTNVENDYGIYTKVKEIEKLIANDYSAPVGVNEVHVPTYDAYFSFQQECYCSRKEQTKSYQEFLNVKKEYEEHTSKLVGYSDEITQKYFTRMEECIEGGNKYALWVAKDKMKLEVINFNEAEKPLNPQAVIEKCKKYTDALILVETDKSLNLSNEVKTALNEAKKQVSAIKSEAERYISSGEFEAHKAKVHAEKIRSEFLPKAVATNANLSSGATKYITGQEMKTYITEKLGLSPVATVLKANVTTEKPEIVKNEFDIPKYKYHVIWVAYKDTEGKCYKAPVYATYNYLGGGSYETSATYSADAPIEMACENVNK